MSAAAVAGLRALWSRFIRCREFAMRRPIGFGATLAAIVALARFALEATIGTQVASASFCVAMQFAALVGGLAAVGSAALASGLLAQIFFEALDASALAGLAIAFVLAILTAVIVDALRLRSRGDARADRCADEALRALWESGPIGAFCWGVGGEVTEANDEFLRMTGYGRDDLTAGRIDWRKATRLRSPAASATETEFARRDGASVRMRLRFVALDEGRARGVAFAQDVAETQELRRRAERSGALAREAVGFAHDVNQPLTAAAAYLQAARRRATLGGGAGSEEQLAAMDRAGAQLHRAARLVAEWRELCAREAQASIALHAAICDAWERVRLDCGDSVRAELRLLAERDLVIGDPLQIERALVDLMRAAVAAALAAPHSGLIIATSASGGEIAVEIHFVGALSTETGGAAFELTLPLIAEPCG
ncbi:PAS domain S-box protein [Methylosinus sporium]|uniref:PAS domain S-box protein n=2 Tax=Methylocystaceae TaxID=31993 RepID=A0A549SCX4_METSR|nr:PAS domain S-box protein [Methylosinus sporium]